MAPPVVNNDLSEGRASVILPEIGSLSVARSVKLENNAQETPVSEVASPLSTHPSRVTHLQDLIQGGLLESLEAETISIQPLLEKLILQLVGAVEDEDAQFFLQQIKTLRDQEVNVPTIIGVVGNTGAGKSAIINAVLEEDNLVPTNCMRACTAVVTEISWNSSDDKNAKYRAEIEFIQPSDWEKDLTISLAELADSNGQISREHYNAESEAGIAYAKIQAVYPNKTKDMLANSTVAELMNAPEVKSILGTTKTVERAGLDTFHRILQYYVDSKEKTTGQSNKNYKGGKKAMGFWPLIKVVRIYTKADVLSTGAVIVDLPGVQDSNAARAAVAAGYIKKCTGLWIVAPITRAVDDKAARSLLGDSFKRQLQYDGTYSRVTFICSKSDDISITEASRSLNLEDQVSAFWAKIDKIDDQLRESKKTLEEFEDSKSIYFKQMFHADDEIEKWESLKNDCEDGEDVWPPVDKSKKRKPPLESGESRKKVKGYKLDSHNSASDSNSEDELDLHSTNTGSEPGSDRGDPLTIVAIEEKLLELKGIKKRARKERLDIDTRIKSVTKEILAFKKEMSAIESTISAICIKGRNDYSKGAIQMDFAAGIKELDQENAQEEDEAHFNPELEVRNYEEVAQSLPVFCCSARAYQKMSGRLLRDSAVTGFRSIEETEIPQLQQHCKHLTESVRASNCRRYLTKFSQLINSLSLWASNDGTGLIVTNKQRAAATRVLKYQLQELEKALDSAVKETSEAMDDALEGNIFQNFDNAIQKATVQALPTAEKWGLPINKLNRAAGGFAWGTYKALCRRDGVFTCFKVTHDLNSQLVEPLIRNIASNWERAFSRKLPNVLRTLNSKIDRLLTRFHAEVNAHGTKQGVSAGGMATLNQQNVIYASLITAIVTEALDMVNSIQRDANRDFTPVIANKLAPAYNTCAAESGPGQFQRMKTHMESHVDTNVNMFTESCDGVKQSLTTMSNQVTQLITRRVDEVFELMSRDYTTVISGRNVGNIMPKAERQMRAEILRLIEGDGDATPVANNVKKEPDSDTLEGESRDTEMTEPPSPGRTYVYEPSDIKSEPGSGLLEGGSRDA